MLIKSTSIIKNNLEKLRENPCIYTILHISKVNLVTSLTTQRYKSLFVTKLDDNVGSIDRAW